MYDCMCDLKYCRCYIMSMICKVIYVLYVVILNIYSVYLCISCNYKLCICVINAIDGYSLLQIEKNVWLKKRKYVVEEKKKWLNFEPVNNITVHNYIRTCLQDFLAIQKCTP